MSSPDPSSYDHLFNRIKEPVVCQKCFDEFAQGLTDYGSLQQYAALDVGFTDQGIQIWCRRHDVNVCHVDFGGMALDVDFRCLEKSK